MIPCDVKSPTAPIPFHKLLKVVAIVDRHDELYPPGIGVIVPGERWDERAQPMLDYFLAFQESFNRFPGFNYEVEERVAGRIKFHTYVVRE
jgi:arginine/lysine/ornithine decarboxylase